MIKLMESLVVKQGMIIDGTTHSIKCYGGRGYPGGYQMPILVQNIQNPLSAVGGWVWFWVPGIFFFGLRFITSRGKKHF